MSERDQIAQAMLAAQLERNPAHPPQAWTEGVKGAIGGLAAIPSRMMGAAQRYTDTGQYDPAPIVEGAGMLMGGGMPMAAKGAAGVFGGRLGQTADLAALMKAEDMALNRKTAPAIWKETGWVQRGDKQWRNEISDKDTGFNQTYLNRLRSDDRDRLGSVFQHPELYKAYPGLQDIRLGHSLDLPERAMGYYLPEKVRPDILRQQAGLPRRVDPAELVINARLDPAEKVTTALHELQHAVQSAEGFAMGGAPPDKVRLGTPAFSIFKELKPKLAPEKLEQLSPQTITTLLTGRSDKSYSPEAINKFINDMRVPGNRDRAAESFAKQQAYHRLLGESEARLTQTRGTMTAEERRKVFPTLDVPVRKSIVRMSDDQPW